MRGGGGPSGASGSGAIGVTTLTGIPSGAELRGCGSVPGGGGGGGSGWPGSSYSSYAPNTLAPTAATGSSVSGVIPPPTAVTTPPAAALLASSTALVVAGSSYSGAAGSTGSSGGSSSTSTGRAGALPGASLHPTLVASHSQHSHRPNFLIGDDSSSPSSGFHSCVHRNACKSLKFLGIPYYH